MSKASQVLIIACAVAGLAVTGPVTASAQPNCVWTPQQPNEYRCPQDGKTRLIKVSHKHFLPPANFAPATALRCVQPGVNDLAKNAIWDGEIVAVEYLDADCGGRPAGREHRL